MLKRVCVFVIGVFLITKVSYAFDVSAKSAILYEPETGTILYSKDIESHREMASTTKIMTAVVVLENSDVSDVVTVPEECVGVEGTSMYLQKGERLSVSDLLYGLLLRSGNDAAEVLAHYVGNNDINAFVEMMNETARKIGMENSSFANPHGLPSEEHFSTALDMAKLAAYAMKIPEFAEIVGTKEKRIGERLLVNHNKLLRMYEGANGCKTGYTKAAGRCLVSSAERNDMGLIAVTLAAGDDWNDHMKLFDFGFENYVLNKTAEIKEVAAEVPVVGGVENSLSAVYARNVSVLQRTGEKLETQIYLPRFVYAPISKGEQLGSVEYFINGELVDSVALVSIDSVQEHRIYSLIEKLFNLFRSL